MKVLAAMSLLMSLAALSGDSRHTSRFRQLSIPVGAGPRWVAVADVNHDSNPDIVVANADAGNIAVLLGDGKGNFHPAAGSPFPAGHLPNDIAFADMNGDGNLDLVIANHQAPYITILLGDGSGSFKPAPGSPFDVHSNPHPHGVVAADFSGDGKPDVVTDSWASNQIELLPGDGKGGLRLPGVFFQVGHRPYERLRSADFNHDGHPDIVTTNLDDGTVSIMQGNGKGGFAPATGSPFRAGAKPWQVAVADLNEDGNEDLAIIPYQRDIASESENAMTVLLGDGKGAFAPMSGTPVPLGACRGPDSVAAGTLENKSVIVVGCAESKELLIFDRKSDGHFERSSIPSKGGWGAVAIADLTKDGRGEIITADNGSSSIAIYFPE